ncbi:MAG: hypothetical protein IPP51_10445 [Bacteroidetes bacterium]|nr:hypothetical protein [Bacteroidota bacterium]
MQNKRKCIKENMRTAHTYTLIVILTISLFACTSNSQENNKIVLKDGWYLVRNDGGGIKRGFTPKDTILLLDNPSISFNDIKSTEPELLNIYADTIAQMNFNLTENGKKEWNTITQNPKNTEMYFVLDDTIINLLQYLTTRTF